MAAPFRRKPVAVVAALCAALVLQGCFDPVYPQLDREERVMEALAYRDDRALPPSPLTASDAVLYALCNNLDAKVAEIETAYHNESAVAARRRLLPNLNVRYNLEHSNHPGARWSESTRTGTQSLESSYSADPDHRQGEISLMWNILDFGVGYLRSRQQGEKIRHSEENYRRVRQQVVLDVLTHYWRTSAAITVAREAEELRAELEGAARAIQDSVDMRILSGAEGARRELTVHAGLTELDQWRRVAGQARLDLARVLGSGNAVDFVLADFPEDIPDLSELGGDDPSALQTAALQRRPELFQQDSQERVAVDEARLALLQMAPNANLSLGIYDDPDKFLEWNNWMSVGARVSWNLFNIPARLAEKRMANLQGDIAHRKGLALAAAIMAQVGIAYSDWRVSHEMAASIARRTAARERLVEALAAGESDGQTRPGEVLQERVRLLADRAAALRALAEARVAGARLANAVGLDVDDQGRLLWQSMGNKPVDLLATKKAVTKRSRIRHDEAVAAAIIPATVPGMRVVMAEDFEAPAEYFFESARKVEKIESREPVPRKLASAPPPVETASSKPAREEVVAMAPPMPPQFGESKRGDLMPMMPSTPIGEDEATRINRWADESGSFVPAPPAERAKAASRPEQVAAVEKEQHAVGESVRMVPADQMRKLYTREKEDPKWTANSPSARTPTRDAMEIPALSVDDFGGRGSSRLKDPRAWETQTEDEILAGKHIETGRSPAPVEWKTVNPNEYHELYSMGLVSSEDALWSEPALRPLEPLSAPASSPPDSSGSLRPPPMPPQNPVGNSVRPGGGSASEDDVERKRALAPLRMIGPNSGQSVAEKPEARPLKPASAKGHLAQLW